MFLFPIAYISAFLVSLSRLWRGKAEGILLFFVFGLPIYNTALSIAFSFGFKTAIPAMQAFKEVVVLCGFLYAVFTLKKKIHFHLVDKLVMGYFLYCLLYVLLPVGSFGTGQKLIALKGIAFFPFVYFIGRLVSQREIFIARVFHLVCIVSVAAAALAVLELVSGQHFQQMTGYRDFNFYYFGQEASGNYGLTWTFETSAGQKRFASFFANPLEHAASTVLTLAILAALYTQTNRKIRMDRFGVLVLCCTLLSIFAALSRSSLVSYFFLLYVYSLLTRKIWILRAIHAAALLAVVYFTVLITNKDVQEFVISTIQFTDSSSIGHVVEWIEGIESMMRAPLGIGLGESGRVSIELKENVGGENQFIIIGVQVGVIGLLLYAATYIALLTTAWKRYHTLRGKAKKICLALLLLKIGLIIPAMTSEIESSAYISYMVWFLSGLFINAVTQPEVLQPFRKYNLPHDHSRD